MRNVVVHTWSHKEPNGFLCGKRGGSPYITGHIDGITCGNCKRIILRSKKLCKEYRVEEWLRT